MDILLTTNGLLLAGVAFLYGSNIPYEGTPQVRMLVIMQSVTALVLCGINIGAAFDKLVLAEWVWLSRPAFTFFLVSMGGLAYITRDSRRK